MKQFIILILLSISFVSSSGTNKEYDFIVSADGSGDFVTVQAAINAVPDFRKKTTTVYIKNGTYKEKLILPASKNFVTLIGESAENTIITYDDFASRKNRFGEEVGTTGSTSFYVFGSDFTAINLTFENSAGAVGQAVAVRVDGDRTMFYRCRFLGSQDTLYPHGEKSRQYYKECYVEGTVDFIFGWSTAVFDECNIFCKSSGYITAASTTEATNFGFVFRNCKIEGSAKAGSVYLGRPWRPFSKTVFMGCEMSEVIHPKGWHNWNKPDAEKTAFYAEYANVGPGSNSGDRVPWAKHLSKEEAAKYTLTHIFDGWNALENESLIKYK